MDDLGRPEERKEGANIVEMVCGVTKQVREERENLRALNRLMGVDSVLPYSKKTVKKVDEDRQITETYLLYLVFDLEMTRRENRYLRKLIRERGEF